MNKSLLFKTDQVAPYAGWRRAQTVNHAIHRRLPMTQKEAQDFLGSFVGFL
jgi:hypothetical protein